jgi:hypothetical protein
MKSTANLATYANNPELLSDKSPNLKDLFDEVQSGNIKRTATATTYTALVTDHYIGVTSTASARTINLPAAATCGAGKVFIVKDESGAAGTNNITLDCNASETIDGATTKVISTNYGSTRIMCDGSNWFTF